MKKKKTIAIIYIRAKVCRKDRITLKKIYNQLRIYKQGHRIKCAMKNLNIHLFIFTLTQKIN